MNDYEVAVLLDPGLEADLEKGTKKLEKIFADSGVKITKTDNWGKKKLAYKIKGQDHAVYIFYTVEMDAQAVRKVESLLNITTEVMRYLVSKVDHKSIKKAEEIRKFKVERAANRTGRDEEETEEQD